MRANRCYAAHAHAFHKTARHILTPWVVCLYKSALVDHRKLKLCHHKTIYFKISTVTYISQEHRYLTNHFAVNMKRGVSIFLF